MSLINCDPLNPANTASAFDIRAAGFGGVRLVSRPEVADAAREFQAHGLFVLSVVTEQSGGFLIPDADLTQCGNEPDIDGTADSMSADDYARYLRLYRDTYPGVPMITGGLASGQAVYLKALRDSGALRGFLGVGLHYPANQFVIGNFLKYTDNLPIYVTEWWADAPLIPAYRLMLRQSKVALDARFSWGYEQFALTDAQKRAINASQ